jgi:gas vesicle protein
VNVQNTLIAGSIVGAVVGAAVSFMFFTEQGRAWREEAQGNLDSLAREAEKLLSAVDQVRSGVAELRSGAQTGWQRTA